MVGLPISEGAGLGKDHNNFNDCRNFLIHFQATFDELIAKIAEMAFILIADNIISETHIIYNLLNSSGFDTY
jgi:hypothetical protein